jgi:hypothetical protein
LHTFAIRLGGRRKGYQQEAWRSQREKSPLHGMRPPL